MSQKGSILSDAVTGVVSLLRADMTLAARVTAADGTVQIFNNVPIGVAPPYIWVLSGEEYDPRDKLGAGHYGRGCTIKVCPVSRYRGTKEIDELGDLAMEALEQQPLAITDYREAGIVWDASGPPITMEAEGGPLFLREITFRASAR